MEKFQISDNVTDIQIAVRRNDSDGIYIYRISKNGGEYSDLNNDRLDFSKKNITQFNERRKDHPTNTWVIFYAKSA